MTHSAPVRIVRDQLVLGSVTVNFQRTLRIPETGLHPLPPGLVLTDIQGDHLGVGFRR